ncbi:group III truncated hemoglobin [Polaribacter sp. KT 15]|uniref:group III truncated hemoglobin n=1 Tax=Polaribacter sp. KT 15 TaxID=1896175 RepID=UPI00090AB94E|nr:group III truncated hemoglobin [Polaribacter sp. KT 15]SHN01194.1 hemoglobin [Polaribacter sp. KT 15]
MIKKDISSRKDIKLIITNFYDLLLKDDQMLPFFEDILINNHLNEHLEIITDFWNDILFQTTTYKNNTMQKHIDKNAFIEFKKKHFAIWTSYLFTTIDANFFGEIAQQMKNRATSIATVMQLKMNLYKP